ncbi:IFT1B protein, partial [Polyodon spathula]|nr:IFT1B protein [Polyodon spathula]
MLPPQDKHLPCARCLGMQHASSAFRNETFWSSRARRNKMLFQSQHPGMVREVQELTQETGPSSEVTSEADVNPPSSSVRALMNKLLTKRYAWTAGAFYIMVVMGELVAAGEAETFDFAFIDADKANYDQYYKKCLLLLRKGGIIAIDNVLWGRKVLNPEKGDNDTQCIHKLNEKIHRDTRVNIGLNEEAIQDLEKDEEITRKDHGDEFEKLVIVTYGKFAWVYYHMGELTEAQSYLEKLEDICRRLSITASRYTVVHPKVYGEKALLRFSRKHSERAKECFRKALKEEPAENEWDAGFTIALYRPGVSESGDPAALQQLRRALELNPADTMIMAM